MELWQRSAQDLAAGIAVGEVGAREVLDAHLGRIDAVNGPVNAVIARDDDAAHAQADAADAAVARGDLLGPLHGVPMTIKDVFDTTGLATTAGALADHVATSDAVAVARLRAAGAVVMGKTNVPVWAGDVQTDNPLFGATNNPWDPARTSGGSSGGAAAALATGMTPLELGSDMAGSIRTPCTWCGVVGHKPTYGIVPVRGHIPPAPGTLGRGDISVVGPMARTVADVTLAFDLLTGADEPEARGWRLELPPPRTPDPSRLRAAAWLDSPEVATDPAVLAVLTAAVAAIESAGVAVDPDLRPDIDMAAHHELGMSLVQAVVGAGLPDKVAVRLRERAVAAGEDPSLLDRAAGWMTQDHRSWLASHERRLHNRVAFEAMFEHVDVVLTPVVCVPAIPHTPEPSFFERTIEVAGATRPYTDLLFWTVSVGAMHLPATVVPVGNTVDGLPVGIQIVGRYLDDLTTLAMASLVEQVTTGGLPPIDPVA